MERIGIYGGTFNPPHLGHVRAAEFAVDALHLDRLYVVPDRIAPHKELPPDSPSPEQRRDMLNLSVSALKKTVISDLELNREGASYTYQTVEQIRRAHPGAEIFLLMGTDMFLTFDQWRNAECILKEVVLSVFCRGSDREEEAILARKAMYEQQGARIVLLENPVVNMSSTDLRRMLIFQCAGPCLPAGVLDYIQENALYGVAGNYRNLPMTELEPVACSLHKPSRVQHILGVRDTAAALAERWGADRTDAARAGILHDITKALGPGLQLTLCAEYGTILDDFSARNPKTLHALTGALVAARVFGENNAVVSAIRTHTTGVAGMNLLQKIIYVADYMEPGRKFEGVERLRQLAFSDLDAALELGLQMSVDLLTRQNRTISPESLEALEWIRSVR